jgi:hypothetical protein
LLGHDLQAVVLHEVVERHLHHQKKIHVMKNQLMTSLTSMACPFPDMLLSISLATCLFMEKYSMQYQIKKIFEEKKQIIYIKEI